MTPPKRLWPLPPGGATGGPAEPDPRWLLDDAWGRLRALLLAGMLAASSGPALAVLGGAVASVQEDQLRLAGTRTQSVHAYHQVHEIVMADGSRIREFVSPSGVVFAVSWNTRFKPDLQALLGSYHAEYDAEAREALRRPGIRRQLSFQHSDLVLESSGRLNHFSGRAWVPSLAPGGLAADALR